MSNTTKLVNSTQPAVVAESEAKRKAAAVLRQWANALEFVDHSGGDPRLCSYCGHPTNSSTCQRSHP